MDISFKILNTDRTKNGKVMRFALLKIKVNGHRKNQHCIYKFK